MSNVYFISDLHLGHEGSLNWARDYREGETMEEMHDWLVSQWNSVVKNKRDLVWVLGDISFDIESLLVLNQMNGRKKMVQGNHDPFQHSVYKDYFEKVVAYEKYKGFWLSHMPIDEFDIVNCRVRGNIHGHLHQSVTGKSHHCNVCVEQCKGVPVNFQHILEYFKEDR